jgi:hypothetical protein
MFTLESTSGLVEVKVEHKMEVIANIWKDSVKPNVFGNHKEKVEEVLGYVPSKFRARRFVNHGRVQHNLCAAGEQLQGFPKVLVLIYFAVFTKGNALQG